MQLRSMRLPLLAMLAVSAAPSYADEHGRQVLQSALNAMGGRRFVDLQEWSLSGKGLSRNIPATFQVHASGPDKKLLRIETEDYQVQQAFDGAAGWERESWEGIRPNMAPYTRELPDYVLDRFKRLSVFLPLVTYARDHAEPKYERQEALDGRKVDVISFDAPNNTSDHVFLARDTHLPIQRTFTGEYEQGQREITTHFSDYRKVGGLVLPFYVEDAAPDMADERVTIEVDKYTLTAPSAQTFRNPSGDHLAEPYELTLSTAPRHIYKEADLMDDGARWDDNPRWGFVLPTTESWKLELLLDEKYGRWVEPVRSTVEMYSGEKKVRTIEIGATELKLVRRRMLDRYSGKDAVSIFRHHFTAPQVLEVDQMKYTMVCKTPSGREVQTTQIIPVSRYNQKTKMIFPVKGNFILLSGHTYEDQAHNDEKTQFGAYDIVVLGPLLEVKSGLGSDTVQAPADPEDYYTFHQEVLATADGVVVYARDDLPNGSPSDLHQRGFPDLLYQFPGNTIIIDHGNGEYTFYCHLNPGTKRVKVGDPVKQGQVIALLGYSNAGPMPHLHWQFMDGPALYSAAGIPSRFENIEMALESHEKVDSPKRGVYLRTMSEERLRKEREKNEDK